VYLTSQQATERYENVRSIIAEYIGAQHTSEIVFTRGATEAINLVAHSWGEYAIKEGDEILITTMEHHANIVPWQVLCEKKNAQLRIIPINDSGEIILEEFEKLLSEKTKLVSCVYASNSLGTINPIQSIIQMAKNVGATVLIDGAQAIQHIPVNMQELNCDFFVFSGHKLYAPSGTGVLYGKKALLQAMPPYQTGGDMIRRVTFEKTTYADIPARFEAGTPNIEGIIGLGEAVRYVQKCGLAAIAEREALLLEYGTHRLMEIPDVRIWGTAKEKVAVISFTLGAIHPHDIGSLLDREGIAVRAGHHCTQPLWQRFAINSTTRASFAFYNTEQEIDTLVDGLKNVVSLFG
jgi:cysteine desulfurase/selenocysteine lyase